MGGDTPEIEVNAMRGKGRFPAYGTAWDVMKESAEAGISCYPFRRQRIPIFGGFLSKA